MILLPFKACQAEGRFSSFGEKVLEKTVSGGTAADAVIPKTTQWLLYLSIGLFTIALIGIFVLILMKKRRMVEV